MKKLSAEIRLFQGSMFNSGILDYAICHRQENDLNPNEILTTEEKDVYQKFRSLKRRDEYIFGRVMIKRLVKHRTTWNYSDISVLNEQNGIETGKPILYLGGKPSKMMISISHDYDYVATLLGKQRVGIDILKIRKDIPFEHKELKMIRDYDYKKDVISCLVWTIKEAFIKAIGTGFVFGLGSVKVVMLNLAENTMYLEISDKLLEYLGSFADIIFWYEEKPEYVCTICVVKQAEKIINNEIINNKRD